MAVSKLDGYLVTAESVTEGHPDKVCDQISDAILDAYLAADPQSHVAVETMAAKNTIIIAGEITSSAKIDICETARQMIRDIGYTDKSLGFCSEDCLILTSVSEQSPDIALGVCGKEAEGLGAGDQGIMYGYACDETPALMPLPWDIANRLAMRLAWVRKQGILPWIYPDGKTQVTMWYTHDGRPKSIHSIIVSSHHSEAVSQEFLREAILDDVIYPTIDRQWLGYGERIHINPTGSFTVGGPAADTGLTGRKIMVDTYGGIGKHGGGAFSGKDPTKVDRSAAYMARYVAKNIVAAGLAEKCEVALAYAIGKAEPEAVTVNAMGTQRIPLAHLESIVRESFSFSVASILDNLELRRPQYRKTATYGHFGKENEDFRWEMVDRAGIMREKALMSMARLFIHK